MAWPVLLVLLAGCAGRTTPSVLAPVDAGDARAETERLKRSHAAAIPTLGAPAAGDPLPQTPLSQLSEKTSLETILRQIAENSPMVQAARHKALAAAQKRGQVVTLPDPKVEFRYFVRRMDSTNPQWELMLSQEIPYPGKLVIAGKIADRETEAATLRYQSAVRDAFAEAKEAYFELFYIDRAQNVTTEIKGLYDRYAALAAGGVEVAKPKLPETFRAESQRAQLSYDLVLLKEMRTAEAERLRSTAGLPRNLVLGPTEDVAEPGPLGESLEKLQEIAEAHNQELAAAGIEIERAQLQTKLARRAPIPDLMVGGGFMRPGPVPADTMPMKNGFTATVGVSVPIWFGKYRAMAKEAQEMEAAAVSEAEAQRLQLRADLAKAYFSLNNSSRLVRLYRETLLPQARQALQSAEELYRKGQANLAGVLETTATLHNFELARLRATADFYQNVARLERLLGTAMDLRPAAEPQPPPAAGAAPAPAAQPATETKP